MEFEIELTGTWYYTFFCIIIFYRVKEGKETLDNVTLISSIYGEYQAKNRLVQENLHSHIAQTLYYS